MILYGTLNGVKKEKTKKGVDASLVEIQCRGKYDPKTKSFGKDTTKGVWYFNTPKAPFADWAAARKTDIGRPVILTAREVISNGKVSYFGNMLPTTYGFLRSPAELRETTPDIAAAAAMAIDDAKDARLLPAEVDINLQDADSIASAIAVIAASGSEVAASAVDSLKKLIYEEQFVYIGKIGYAARSGKTFRVSFASPRSSPAEWNSVSFFGTTADNAEKVLKKGDTVILVLAEKGEYNGSPTYVGRSFVKI